MTPIAIATEDELSEAIAIRLLSEIQSPYYITHRLRKGGFGYLRSRMDSWRQMAKHQVMMVLTDLDRADCVVDFRDEWLAHKPVPESLLFRVAVREMESWALADHEAMRALIGVRGVLPVAPDELPDPKQVLLRLANGAPRPVKVDLLKTVDGTLYQGLGYNACLTEWVGSVWNPQRAAERSPSLARARHRLQEVVNAFGAPRLSTPRRTIPHRRPRSLPARPVRQPAPAPDRQPIHPSPSGRGVGARGRIEIE